MSDIDIVLRLLENPTRRRILRRLTVETHYPLQLAKELKISPQAVMKHLKIMERNGLVKCIRSESNMGPTRKCYYAVKRISLRLDMAPHLFETRITSQPRETHKLDAKGDALNDDPEELMKLREKLSRINQEINMVDKQLFDLIRVKEEQLDRANRIIQQHFVDYEEREIIHYILTHNDFSLTDLSESLGLREKLIRDVLSRLSEMGFIPRKVK